jgi:hypothetical protein
MKSSNEQLQSRGFATDKDLLEYNIFNENQLIALLKSKEPHKRTIGIKLLSKYKNEKYRIKRRQKEYF